MIESHVTTLETSQRLKASGFRQDTLCAWVTADGPEPFVATIGYDGPYGAGYTKVCAAYLLSEILEQFPNHATVEVWLSASGNVESCAYAEVALGEIVQARHTNPAEAAALLWEKVKA